MEPKHFYKALNEATTCSEAETAIYNFLDPQRGAFKWVPVGRRLNNRGIIDVSADPGRSLVERVTNAIDAVLEMENEAHHGMPNCRTPREAAMAWFNVPESGLAGISPAQRRVLARRVTVRILPGEARESRVCEVRDTGIGLSSDQMPATILSLNESNKLQKHYLAGTYGQGGSSTFAVSKYTFIASRCTGKNEIGFTVVRYLDLPPEEYKTGHYVYLTLNDSVLTCETTEEEFPVGTQVRHFGYDLTSYPSPLGPNSVYGLLNQTLFDPLLPIWLDERVHDYRRVIKGSRNALNGALDEGDDAHRGPKLSHNIKMFYVSLADYGRIGIEYWVLERPDRENKRPTAAFVNPTKPIILTFNGQNHAELSSLLIRKFAELPYLSQRLICHIECNSLSPAASRALFASTREDARRGVVYDLIQQELIRVLKSDDELARLNNEARQEGRKQEDEAAAQEMRREVSRLLHIRGVDVAQVLGGTAGAGDGTSAGMARTRTPRPTPQPIELHDPPSYIRILWPEGESINFHAEQRRYLRIETDAQSSYHNATDPANSRINIMVTDPTVRICGSTPLEGGRLRAIMEAAPSATVGSTGTIRVELSRPGLPILYDERPFRIIDKPPTRPAEKRSTFPPFRLEPVEGPEDPKWSALGWPDETSAVASSALMENGTLVIHYSTVYPNFASHLFRLEQKDSTLAASYTERYKIWLAVHSLLLYQDQQIPATSQTDAHQQEDPEAVEAQERQERCRIATLSSLFAVREISTQPHVDESE